MSMITKCASCNKKFNTFHYKIKRHKNLFCSNQCRYAFTNTRVKLKCKQCGISYKVKKYRKDVSDYCSRNCHNVSMESREITYCIVCKKEIAYKKSRIKYGIPNTCSKKCMGLLRSQVIKKTTGQPYLVMHRTGVNHPCYKNGISLYTKYAIKHKDDLCHLCKSPKKIHVHHIDGNRNNNTKYNWIPICRSCHTRIHVLVDKLNLNSVKAFNLFTEFKLFSVTVSEFRKFRMRLQGRL